MGPLHFFVRDYLVYNMFSPTLSALKAHGNTYHTPEYTVRGNHPDKKHCSE